MAAAAAPRRDPPPLRLAWALAPVLRGVHWGIGGSLLAWRCGLPVRPHDLDILTRVADFDAVSHRLAARLREVSVAPDPRYATRRFARFRHPGGALVDVMAGLGVHSGGRVVRWRFDPATLIRRDGLPWMRPADWVRIYDLLGRPQASARLQAYLQHEDAHVPAGPLRRSPLRREGRRS